MLRILLVAAPLKLPAPAFAVDDNCGYSPDDWCTAETDGPYGCHVTADACRADPACRGMEYRGESVVACHWDGDWLCRQLPDRRFLDRK